MTKSLKTRMANLCPHLQKHPGHDLERYQNLPTPHPLNIFWTCPKNNRGPQLPPRNAYAKFQIHQLSYSLYFAQTSIFIDSSAVTLPWFKVTGSSPKKNFQALSGQMLRMKFLSQSTLAKSKFMC